MNFSPFGSPFPGSIPGIHQFAASSATSAQVIFECKLMLFTSLNDKKKCKKNFRTQPIDITAPMWICRILTKHTRPFSVNFVPMTQSIQIWINTTGTQINTPLHTPNNPRTINDRLQLIHNLPWQLRPQLKQRLSRQKYLRIYATQYYNSKTTPKEVGDETVAMSYKIKNTKRLRYSFAKCEHRLAIFNGWLFITSASEYIAIVATPFLKIFRWEYKKGSPKSVNGKTPECHQ